MHKGSPLRQELVIGNKSRKDVSEDVIYGVKGKKKFWFIAFGIAGLFLVAGGYCLYRVWWDGIGMWGENKSVNWAWGITNFVWWIGIGHAGTFISAILLLLRAEWRNSINRAAEAMTLCAVSCSAFFILAHLGRPWLFYWVFPFSNTLGPLWMNFNSALVWDAFAILTYLLASLVFWYLGLVPDLAELRNRSSGKLRKIYKMFSLNWDNSAWKWRRYQSLMYNLAGLATVLVVSVHSIVAMDFANSILHGWHSTIFPAYFVIGAILSGLAMVISILVPLRKLLGLESYITLNHFDKINQLIILISILIGVSYFTEIFKAYYVGGQEAAFMTFRMTGAYSAFFITMVLANVFLPQLLWFRSLRRNILFSFIMSIVINIGMWSERFLIIVSSLSHTKLPSARVSFYPTLFDLGVFVFSIGLFLFLFLLFVRYLPVVNMSEVKAMVKPRAKKAEKKVSLFKQD